ncbi:MAG: thioredoxin family protein [Planctomycetes bacterium]|jgi:thiol:disulfide interchange protein DsbD|nr:thioredoxin family protein [Planctomycetota bacterium]MCL4730798.1 thioredoxin family protein [Planctomycetota bacterium]
MKRLMLAGLAAAGLCCLPVLPAQDKPDPKESKESKAAEKGLKFGKDLEAAKKLAAEQKKGIFIDFMAEWCGPCKMLDAQVWSDESVAARVTRDYVPVKIDVDEQPDVSARYEIQAMPTLVIADAAGEVLARTVGAAFDNPKDAIKWFDDVVAALKELPALEKAFNESKNADVAAATKLVDGYVKVGLTAKAFKICQSLLEGRDPKDKAVIDLRLKYADMLMDEIELEDAMAQLKLAAEAMDKGDKRMLDVRLKMADCRLYADEHDGLEKELESLYADLIKAGDDRAIDVIPKLANLVVWLVEDEAAQVQGNKKVRALCHETAKALKDTKRKTELAFYAAYFAWGANEHDVAKKEMKAVVDAKDGKWSKIAADILKQWENPGDPGDTPDEG